MRKKVRKASSSAGDIYSKDYVSNLFDNMSATYGLTNYISSFGFTEVWRHSCINQLPEYPELKVGYDLMTGMGELWASFNNRFDHAEIKALDISPMMLAQAAVNISKYKNKITLQQTDVLSNSIADNSADFIVCSFGLKTFNKEQLTILANEVARILKPGGVFSFVEISVPQNILKPFYMFYLKKVIPTIGKLFLGDAENYKMLGIYTSRFKDCTFFFEALEKRDVQVNYHNYFWGCATGVSGRKI